MDRLSETLHDLVQTGRRDRLAQVLQEAHAADIATAVRDLSVADQVTVFRLLGREQAGGELAALDDQTLLALVRALDEAEVSSGLDRVQPADSARRLVEL